MAGQGCGGTNTLQRVRVEQFSYAAQQERNIRSLPPSVGVKLVQHEKLQSLCRKDEFLFARPCENQLQHDVVRQEDVGRGRDDPGARLFVFLPGVTLEGDGAFAVREPKLEKLL